MVNFCCVNGCKKECYPGCGLSFHKIPKDQKIAEKWMKIIPGKVSKSSVVCKKHFKDEDYVHNLSKILKPNSIPSIFPIIKSTNETVPFLKSTILEHPEENESVPEDPCSSGPTEKQIRKMAEESTQTRCLIAVTTRERKLKREIRVLTKRLARRNATIHKLKLYLAMVRKRLPK